MRFLNLKHGARRVCRSCAPLAVSTVLLAFVAACATAPPQSRGPYEIVGYYAGWKGPIAIDARQLTVLNYAFLDICWDGEHGNAAAGGVFRCRDIGGSEMRPPNGSVVVDNPALDAANFARLRALREAHPHLRLVASVGGWTRSNRFSDMAADERTRASFIASVVAFLREQRFDGIDLDWEYPGSIGVRCAPGGNNCDRATDKANFVLLARGLRAALDAAGAADGKRYLSTIAAGADADFVYDAGSGAWLAELAKSLDWINLMTYDYHGTWESRAGFVAPLYRDAADPTPLKNADASVALFLEQGIPRDKLTLGQPFYGKGWGECSPGPNGDGLYQDCAGPLADPPEAAFEFATLAEKGYLAPDAAGKYTRGGLGFTRHWNKSARVPYLYNPATRIFISYDDEESIREKNRYVIEKRLRGAMFWELNADRHRVLGTIVSEDLPH